jgi:hypothetical protein
MSIKYYNANDELTRTIPKNHLFPFLDDEKYAVIEDQDPIVNVDYVEADDLLNKKKEKKEKIKNKTAGILSIGFQYNGNTFSLDLGSQVAWSNLMLGITHGATLTFPYYIKNIEDEPVSFANNQEIIDCFNAGVAHVSNLISNEGTLLNDVNSASDFTALNSIEDNR